MNCSYTTPGPLGVNARNRFLIDGVAQLAVFALIVLRKYFTGDNDR